MKFLNSKFLNLSLVAIILGISLFACPTKGKIGVTDVGEEGGIKESAEEKTRRIAEEKIDAKASSGSLSEAEAARKELEIKSLAKELGLNEKDVRELLDASKGNLSDAQKVFIEAEKNTAEAWKTKKTHPKRYKLSQDAKSLAREAKVLWVVQKMAEGKIVPPAGATLDSEKVAGNKTKLANDLAEIVSKAQAANAESRVYLNSSEDVPENDSTLARYKTEYDVAKKARYNDIDTLCFRKAKAAGTDKEGKATEARQAGCPKAKKIT